MVSDALREWLHQRLLRVLILVLMEYGLWHLSLRDLYVRLFCLNPCSNGIWSLTLNKGLNFFHQFSLNPCSNGIWSLTTSTLSASMSMVMVLILVLMEYGLWRTWDLCPRFSVTVLILVLMEYGLWLLLSITMHPNYEWVLILVLMEYGLWRYTENQYPKTFCLNPCSNGIWSLTLIIILRKRIRLS